MPRDASTHLRCQPWYRTMCKLCSATRDAHVTASPLKLGWLLKIRKKERSAILLVTHHMGVARAMADKVLVMKKGHAVEYGTAEQIFLNPQEACCGASIAWSPLLTSIVAR